MRETPIAIASTVLLALLMIGGLGRIDALVLAVAFVAALGLMLIGSRAQDSILTAEVDEYAGPTPRLSVEWLRAGAALVGVIAGSQALVWGAIGIAEVGGLSDAVIGLTIIAVGTSLPELVTAIQAARRGEPDLIVGNLLGSTVFNSTAIVAVAAFIAPGGLDAVELGPTIAMVLVTVLAGVVMFTNRRIGRVEGIVLVCVYTACVPLVFLGS